MSPCHVINPQLDELMLSEYITVLQYVCEPAYTLLCCYVEVDLAVGGENHSFGFDLLIF